MQVRILPGMLRDFFRAGGVAGILHISLRRRRCEFESRPALHLPVSSAGCSVAGSISVRRSRESADSIRPVDDPLSILHEVVQRERGRSTPS